MYWDSTNKILHIKDILHFCWTRRSGYTFVFMGRHCGVEWLKNTTVHVNKVYFQILNYGGYIAWKSKKCYQ
jgi:hypothetical protein